MKVKCPTCKKEVEFSAQNRYRPFCSERCSTLDLGAWADEKYRVPVEEKSVNEKSLDESVATGEFPSKDELN